MSVIFACHKCVVQRRPERLVGLAMSDTDMPICSVYDETTQIAASTTLSACNILFGVLMPAHGHKR